jgi:hypothetical protein
MGMTKKNFPVNKLGFSTSSRKIFTGTLVDLRVLMAVPSEGTPPFFL